MLSFQLKVLFDYFVENLHKQLSNMQRIVPKEKRFEFNKNRTKLKYCTECVYRCVLEDKTLGG